MKLLSKLFKMLGKIRLPKFNLSFGRKKYKSRTYRRYKIKSGAGWNLKKQPGMPNSPKQRGLPVRVKSKSRKK